MASLGLEYGEHAGLGWIEGRVVALAPTNPASRSRTWAGTSCRFEIPTIRCWRDWARAPTCTSSTAIVFAQARTKACVMCWPSVDYGGPLAAMVGRDNLVGTQFHPEKSQAVGLAPAHQLFDMGTLMAETDVETARPETEVDQLDESSAGPRPQRPLRRGRGRDPGRRRVRLADAAAAPDHGDLLEGRAAGARAAALRRPARRHDRRLRPALRRPSATTRPAPTTRSSPRSSWRPGRAATAWPPPGRGDRGRGPDDAGFCRS